MPLYRYEALDQTGNTVRGAMQVSDERALATRLTSMGYRPLSVQVAGGNGAVARPQRQVTGQPVVAQVPTAAPGSKLTANERSMARMYHQLYISFRAGMPAYQAFSTVAGQVHERSLRQVLQEMALGVQQGQYISVLMERYPRLFSRGDVGMIRAAEMAGFLPEALQSLSARHEQDDNTRRRLVVWIWFFHSNVICLALMIALGSIFFAWFSTGNFMNGLRAVGTTFMTVSVPMLVVYFGFIAWLKHARHNPAWAHRWHAFLLKLPMVAKLNYLRANAVFTRTLQQLYQAGIMPAFAWETAAGAVPNVVLADRYMSGKPVVESTARLSMAMQQVGLLDVTDVGMVATGESAGEVPQALKYLADKYEEDTRVALGATVVRGALTFTLWAFLMGLLAFAVFCYGYYGRMFEAVDKFMGVE